MVVVKLQYQVLKLIWNSCGLYKSHPFMIFYVFLLVSLWKIAFIAYNNVREYTFSQSKRWTNHCVKRSRQENDDVAWKQRGNMEQWKEETQRFHFLKRSAIGGWTRRTPRSSPERRSLIWYQALFAPHYSPASPRTWQWPKGAWRNTLRQTRCRRFFKILDFAI